MNCPKEIRKWYAAIGRKGGKRSRRSITRKQQAKMQRARHRMTRIRKHKYTVEELNNEVKAVIL